MSRLQVGFVLLALGTMSSSFMLFSRRIGLSQEAVVAAGFVCGNHTPPHYARTAPEAERYSETEGCEGWSSVSNGLVRGSVVAQDGLGVGGARISLSAGGNVVIATSITNPSGRFTLISPVAGQYTLRVEAIGFRTFSRPVDAAWLIAEGFQAEMSGDLVREGQLMPEPSIIP